MNGTVLDECQRSGRFQQPPSALCGPLYLSIEMVITIPPMTSLRLKSRLGLFDEHYGIQCMIG